MEQLSLPPPLHGSFPVATTEGPPEAPLNPSHPGQPRPPTTPDVYILVGEVAVYEAGPATVICFFAAGLSTLYVALAAVQLQAGDSVLDDVGRGAVLGGRHAA